MIREDWRHLKAQLAERFFKYELDEVFREGTDHGVTFATRKMSFAVRNMDTSGMTKTQLIGYQRSIEAIEQAKLMTLIEAGVPAHER